MFKYIDTTARLDSYT